MLDQTLAGCAAVFLGVLLNASRESSWSRVVVLPALLLMLLVVAIELHLDEGQAAPIVAAVGSVRRAMETRLI